MTKTPVKSKNIFTDIKYFILNKPKIDSLVQINSAEVRKDFDHRILQRTGYDTVNFNLLNIHKISIDTPVLYVFDEIVRWNWESDCWPNHLAKFSRNNGERKDVKVYLFRPLTFRKRVFGYRLFNLKLIKIHDTPIEHHQDNARYILYESSGGYPIGLFSIYARNSISELNENGMTQLFFVVGFNFYGRKSLSKIKFIRKIWELIHNRVTANILNRFKQLCEAKFDQHVNHEVSEHSFLGQTIAK